MTQEIYDKVKKNIEQFIKQEIDKRDDSYLTENEQRIIDKFTREICNESNLKMQSCTEKETEAYRKLMWSIYKEILFEDKVKLIQLEYKYQETKGMILPEDIEVLNLKSIIYFEYKELQELGINNVKDITSYTIPEITNLINIINNDTKRKENKEKVAEELIKAIHLLGFKFNDEEGYEEQSEYFNRLRRIENNEMLDISNEDDRIKKELYHRKELIMYYDRLVKEKELLLKSLDEVESEILKAKEEIIQKENKIRTRKI